jgi:hypothetical protein
MVSMECPTRRPIFITFAQDIQNPQHNKLTTMKGNKKSASHEVARGKSGKSAVQPGNSGQSLEVSQSNTGR